MPYDERTLDVIYAKTGGDCHCCGQPLKRDQYGQLNASSGWEVDHSKPRKQGGSDHLNNLFPACIPCNRANGARHGRKRRRDRGNRLRPLSQTEKWLRKTGGKTAAATACGLIGLVAGPAGLLIGAMAGAAFADPTPPDYSVSRRR